MSNSNALRKRTALIAAAGLLIAAWTPQSRAGRDAAVDYPRGYRSWTHVKSALIGPTSPTYARYGGIHHIYANEKAMEGYRSGQFPDGAVIVFDLLETKESAGITAEGPRKFIDVMAKDAKRYSTSGGWEYEEFKGDSESERSLNEQSKTACYQCHDRQRNRDFVFSTFRR